MWSILVNFPRSLEKNVYSTIVDKVVDECPKFQLIVGVNYSSDFPTSALIPMGFLLHSVVIHYMYLSVSSI